MKKMKNIVLKFYITVLFFCSTTLLFAQPGDTGDGSEGLEGSDAAAAPIDNYIWVLAIVGILFVIIKFRAIQANKIK
jgi:hypothetical protein